jgi:glycosyltransferase involved in cell wall biosynthesis
MNKSIKVLHLVDDTTAGGVKHVVDFILSSNATQKNILHERLEVKRGKISSTRFDADIIVSHLSISWRSVLALVSLRTANVGKTLIHVEHSYTEGFTAHNVKHKTRFVTLLRFGFSLFDKIIAVSNAQAKWFTDLCLCPAHRITTIQSCVDLEPFRGLPTRRERKRTFAAIGRLDYQKGFDFLVTAFKACPDQDISLHIYGEGDEKLRLQNLANGDDRIIFKGFADNPADAFADVDIVVMPSRWEAYGLVAIEALSAGKALVCSNVDGLRDHQEMGAEILEEYSLSCLSSKLSQMCVENVSLEKALSRRSKLLEQKFFSKWEALILETGTN